MFEDFNKELEDEKQNAGQLPCIYAYIASAKQIGKKLFDEFVPLVEYYLSKEKPSSQRLSIDTIKVGLNELYGINIPTATLIKLLQTMEKEEKITRDISDNCITINHSNLLTKQQEIEDRLENFYCDIVSFFQANNINISEKDARAKIINLISKFSGDFAAFCGNNKAVSMTNIKIEDAKLFEKYFNERVNKNDSLKETFSWLLIGAQKTTLLNLKPTQLSQYTEQEFFIKKVILDSNFVLRILDLQDKFNCDVAKETLNILKQKKVALNVLPTTIKEIQQSIGNFLNDYSINTLNFLKQTKSRVNGFYGALIDDNVKIAHIELYRDRAYIENALREKGITILGKQEVNIPEDKVANLIKAKDRPTYTQDNALHDLLLIDYCKKERKKEKDNANKIWVLTNDIKLTNWSARQGVDTLNTCITEMQLSSMLWIKGIDKSLVVEKAITALADVQSWKNEDIMQFHKEFADFFKEDNCTQENITTLIDNMILSIQQEKMDDKDNESYGPIYKLLTSIKEEKEKGFAELKEKITVLETEKEEQGKKLKKDIAETQTRIQMEEGKIKELTSKYNKYKKAYQIGLISRIIIGCFSGGLIITGLILLIVWGMQDKQDNSLTIIGAILSGVPLVGYLIGGLYIAITLKDFNLKTIIKQIFYKVSSFAIKIFIKDFVFNETTYEEIRKYKDIKNEIEKEEKDLEGNKILLQYQKSGGITKK